MIPPLLIHKPDCHRSPTSKCRFGQVSPRQLALIVVALSISHLTTSMKVIAPDTSDSAGFYIDLNFASPSVSIEQPSVLNLSQRSASSRPTFDLNISPTEDHYSPSGDQYSDVYESTVTRSPVGALEEQEQRWASKDASNEHGEYTKDYKKLRISIPQNTEASGLVSQRRDFRKHQHSPEPSTPPKPLEDNFTKLQSLKSSETNDLESVHSHLHQEDGWFSHTDSHIKDIHPKAVGPTSNKQNQKIPSFQDVWESVGLGPLSSKSSDSVEQENSVNTPIKRKTAQWGQSFNGATSYGQRDEFEKLIDSKNSEGTLHDQPSGELSYQELPQSVDSGNKKIPLPPKKRISADWTRDYKKAKYGSATTT